MTDNMALIDPTAAKLRERFLSWQCRLRQVAVREAAGKPSAGMRPQVLSPTGERLAAAVTVLIVPADPGDSVALFRYQVLRTQDPLERYDNALELLATSYFQDPHAFSDVMTALFAAGSMLVEDLLNFGHCNLLFEQEGLGYQLPCSVAEFAVDHEFFQATFWHNRLYNPNLPAGVRVLGFTPDWRHASSYQPA